jgi:CrcB protein
MRREVLLVFVGGTIGGAARVALDSVFPSDSGVPWDIVVINLLGSFLLGAVVARAEATNFGGLFPAIGPGALGGFTTFSALAGLVWVADIGWGPAAAVLVGSLILCPVAAAAGWNVGWIEAEAEQA